MRQIESIQALRGIAACLVVMHHVALVLPVSASGPSVFHVIAGHGVAGVDLFFVISGFIITLLVDQTPPGERQRADFALRRFLRIFPLYWFYTLVRLVFSVLPGSARLDSAGAGYIVASFLLIPWSNGNNSVHPILDQGWTLSYEVFFYLTFLLLLRCRTLTMVVMTTVLFAALALIGPWFTAAPAPAMVFTRPILMEFVLGMWIGVAFSRGWLTWQRSILIAAVLAAIAVVVGLNSQPTEKGWTSVGLYGSAAGVVVVVALAMERQGWLRVPTWLKTLGDASYSLYLVHGFLTTALLLGFRYYAPARSWPSNLAGPVLTMSIAPIGVIAYWLIERPITRRLQRLRDRLKLQP
jgi:exopolysaccharide production protein ExoZ